MKEEDGNVIDVAGCAWQSHSHSGELGMAHSPRFYELLMNHIRPGGSVTRANKSMHGAR